MNPGARDPHEDGDEYDAWDDPTDDGLEDDDDESLDDATMPCPSCGAEIYDDAEQCSVCGEYVISSTSPWTGKPWWWICLGLIGVLTVLYLSIRF